MGDAGNVNDLKARLSTLSPAKRAWLEQRLRTSAEKKNGREKTCGGPIASGQQ